jgi:transposase
VAKLLLRTLELAFYHLLICVVDRLSRLPRTSVPPDAMRLYRENLALKVQLDALAAKTSRIKGKKARESLRTRAAQVWAYLATRGNRPFQKHHLSASARTIQRWATKLRQGPWKRSAPRKRGGRPPTPAEIIELVLTLKRENPGWGQKKISQMLRRLGIAVSAPTVQRILEDNGYGPPGGGQNLGRVHIGGQGCLVVPGLLRRPCPARATAPGHGHH